MCRTNIKRSTAVDVEVRRLVVTYDTYHICRI